MVADQDQAIMTLRPHNQMDLIIVQASNKVLTQDKCERCPQKVTVVDTEVEVVQLVPIIRVHRPLIL